MKILFFNGEQFKGSKVIKTDTSITVLDENGIEVFVAKGISDFSGYSLEDGQTFDVIEPTQDEVLRAKILKDNASMQFQLAQQQKLNADILLKLAKVGGGTSV